VEKGGREKSQLRTLEGQSRGKAQARDKVLAWNDRTDTPSHEAPGMLGGGGGRRRGGDKGEEKEIKQSKKEKTREKEGILLFVFVCFCSTNMIDFGR